MYTYVDVKQNSKQITLSQNALAFTYCQVPIIYTLSDKIGIKVLLENKEVKAFESLTLDNNISSKIFKRSGEIEQIWVSLTKDICN
jgi:hypothetical protein